MPPKIPPFKFRLAIDDAKDTDKEPPVIVNVPEQEIELSVTVPDEKVGCLTVTLEIVTSSPSNGAPEGLQLFANPHDVEIAPVHVLAAAIADEQASSNIERAIMVFIIEKVCAGFYVLAYAERRIFQASFR